MSTEGRPNQAHWLRVAAVLSFLSLSWPVHLPTLQYVIRRGALPIVQGPFGIQIRALGGGFIEAWGHRSSSAPSGLWRVERVRCISWLLALEATEAREEPCDCSLARLLVLCDRLGSPLHVAHWSDESNFAGVRLGECALNNVGPAPTVSDPRHHLGSIFSVPCEPFLALSCRKCFRGQADTGID
jgi:hypothetical protein